MDKSEPAHQSAPLLLSSLAEFWSLLEPLLEAERARTMCEIGLGNGEFTARLLETVIFPSALERLVEPEITADGCQPPQTAKMYPSNARR